jgi:hypothetical protein
MQKKAPRTATKAKEGVVENRLVPLFGHAVGRAIGKAPG